MILCTCLYMLWFMTNFAFFTCILFILYCMLGFYSSNFTHTLHVFVRYDFISIIWACIFCTYLTCIYSVVFLCRYFMHILHAVVNPRASRCGCIESQARRCHCTDQLGKGKAGPPHISWFNYMKHAKYLLCHNVQCNYAIIKHNIVHKQVVCSV